MNGLQWMNFKKMFNLTDVRLLLTNMIDLEESVRPVMVPFLVWILVCLSSCLLLLPSVASYHGELCGSLAISPL